jgi:hypothetical protein
MLKHALKEIIIRANLRVIIACTRNTFIELVKLVCCVWSLPGIVDEKTKLLLAEWLVNANIGREKETMMMMCI